MSATWIDASRPPVVPGTQVHAMAATPLMLWVVWWSWATFTILLVVCLGMAYLQAKGRHPAWVLRFAQSRLRDNFVQCRPVWYRRRRSRIESYQSLDVHQAYAVAGPSRPRGRPPIQASQAPRAPKS